MKNFIFLDIDGVLNDGEYIEKCYETHFQPMSMDFVPFNPRSLNNLKKIWDFILDNDNEPQIILSSTWRLNPDATYIVKARLAEYGMRIQDTTPYFSSQRGLEIIGWLEENNAEDCPFIILDDDSFDIVCEKELVPHFVQTKFKKGLIGWKTKRAIEILNKGESIKTTRQKLNIKGDK